MSMREALDNPLLQELWEQYESCEAQWGNDYFWRKHGHEDFIARFRAALEMGT